MTPQTPVSGKNILVKN